MPPKVAAAESNAASSLVALCYLMATCTEFKADTSKLTEVLNISHSKNVPRKINTIINPYGFEFREGKVFAKDGDAAVPATPTKKSTNDKAKKQTGTNHQLTNAPAGNGKKKSTPASKKRKVQAIENESGDEEESADKDDEHTTDSTDSGDSKRTVDAESD